MWFLPGLIVIGGAALAVLMVDLSALVDDDVLRRWPRLFGASADSSRDMLAAIAGSLITVAGVTFSITMVAVTQASAQYSPRILRNFMRDRASQTVLGGLAAIFTYCLVVLRTIRGGNGDFVPSVAVLVGFVLAVVGIALLIFFIHHIASALQASSIVDRVASDTMGAVDRLFPAEVGEPVRTLSPDERERVAGATWIPLPARRVGYVQNVDGGTLIDVARRHDTIVRMERGVGEFVIPGLPLASVAAGSGVPTAPDRPGGHGRDGDRRDGDGEWAKLAHDLAGAFDLGIHRTVEQDATFGIRQLVDVALKALSPGINDPTTAMNAVDFIGAVLARAAGRSEEPAFRYDGEVLRVLARGPTFETLVVEALSDIRRYGEGHVGVLGRLAGIIDAVGRLTTDPHRRRVLVQQLDLIGEAIERTVRSPADRESLMARIGSTRSMLT